MNPLYTYISILYPHHVFRYICVREVMGNMLPLQLGRFIVTCFLPNIKQTPPPVWKTWAEIRHYTQVESLSGVIKLLLKD